MSACSLYYQNKMLEMLEHFGVKRNLSISTKCSLFSDWQVHLTFHCHCVLQLFNSVVFLVATTRLHCDLSLSVSNEGESHNLSTGFRLSCCTVTYMIIVVLLTTSSLIKQEHLCN